MDERGYTARAYHIRQGQRGETTTENILIETCKFVNSKKIQLRSRLQTASCLNLGWIKQNRWQSMLPTRMHLKMISEVDR